MAKVKTTSPHSAEPTFERDCDKVLIGLRTAVRKLIAATPGGAIERATDLQGALKIRASLAWQVFRMANVKDVFELVPFTPLPGAMQGVFQAAREAGYPEDAIVAAEKHYVRFEQLVSRHADDRATFDAMVAGLGAGASDQIDIPLRRAAFRSAAQVWGVQARLTYRCLIMWQPVPGQIPQSVIIQGTRGLRALRPGLRVPLCRRVITVSRITDESPEFAPEVYNQDLLTEFCSPNLPAITSEERGATVHDSLCMSGVGLSAELDYFRSTLFENVSDERDPTQQISSMIRMPTEELVIDMLLPARTMDVRSAAVRVCGCMEDVSAAETADERYTLPCAQPARYLGHSLESLRDKVTPRAPEMVARVLHSVGRTGETFDIVRCRMRYPLLHTCVAMLVRRL